jgi:hypothetical protein
MTEEEEQDLQILQEALSRYPTVTTKEELDALPYGTIVLSLRYTENNGIRPWTKKDIRWGDGARTSTPWTSFGSRNRSSEMLTSRISRTGQMPYAVLFNPEAPLVSRHDAWERGFASGKSRAMRHMSDEPHLPLTAPNPYPKVGE